ncbi:MAG: hypothetical protein AUJ82_02385 [Verrucomicrobia bacterium CG1_02_43_26]|nr:MAG: hypothetical protein AUJ82_02385 [Verrucomicrobia bacterium CG1_02_43_26]
MSLFFATILMSVILLATGTMLLWRGGFCEAFLKHFLRSKNFAYLFFGFAAVLFLWNILQLGEADFGEYKHWMFLFFAFITVGSFIWVKDFLAVRGLAIVTLFVSKAFLDAAYMQSPDSRLFLVSFVYLLILLALFLGTVPFYLRDFINWLFTKASRVKTFAVLIFSYGLILAASTLSY